MATSYANDPLVAWPCAWALSDGQAVRPPARVDPVDAIGGVVGRTGRSGNPSRPSSTARSPIPASSAPRRRARTRRERGPGSEAKPASSHDRRPAGLLPASPRGRRLGYPPWRTRRPSTSAPGRRTSSPTSSIRRGTGARRIARHREGQASPSDDPPRCRSDPRRMKHAGGEEVAAEASRVRAGMLVERARGIRWPDSVP
jgi:hypothetical protein